MKAHIDIPMAEKRSVERHEREAHGTRHLLRQLKKWISKYVTVEKDAIFKDPDWPHLWDHKR